MQKNKYNQLWVSYSSISDYINCPRSYFLKNIYKDPETGHKIMLVTPQLSMGSVVHDLLESLANLPTEKRFASPITEQFEEYWEKVTGPKGGFTNEDIEEEYKRRAYAIIQYVEKNPGPLTNATINVRKKLLDMTISEEDEIVLCGKVDWLEYDSKTDMVNIIDFKTGRRIEKDDSLQLPIYILLAEENQKRKVNKIFYWYLEYKMPPQEVQFDNRQEAKERVYDLARSIRLARLSKQFNCKTKGCFYCDPFERIIKGEGRLIDISSMRKNMYILNYDENNSNN